MNKIENMIEECDRVCGCCKHTKDCDLYSEILFDYNMSLSDIPCEYSEKAIEYLKLYNRNK